MKKRLGLAMSVWALALACALLPQAWLAKQVSLPLMRLTSSLCALAPFPVAEVLIITGAAALVLTLALSIVRAVQKRGGYPLVTWLVNLTACAGALVLILTLGWTPIARTNSYPEASLGHSQEDLSNLCAQLTVKANALRSFLPDTLTYDVSSIPESAQAAWGCGELVKFARYPEWMDAMGIAGICFPLTGETILNPHEALLTLPFAACHETAHQLGYGREDEASYAAYRACLRGDTFFRYSGTMYALYYAMDALRSEDGGAWLEQTRQMSEAVNGDYYRMNGYLSAEIPPRQKKMGRISEAFLRLSGQDGLKSYGRMVDLLLSNPDPEQPIT